MQLVCFFDGGVDEAKLTEWLQRRGDDLKKCTKIAQMLSENEMPSHSQWVPPLYVSKWLGAAFAEHGVPVYYTPGEADREMARHCRDTGCAAILGKDSDFFVLPVPFYLVLDSLNLRAQASAYVPSAAAPPLLLHTASPPPNLSLPAPPHAKVLGCWSLRRGRIAVARYIRAACF